MADKIVRKILKAISDEKKVQRYYYSLANEIKRAKLSSLMTSEMVITIREIMNEEIHHENELRRILHDFKLSVKK